MLTTLIRPPSITTTSFPTTSSLRRKLPLIMKLSLRMYTSITFPNNLNPEMLPSLITTPTLNSMTDMQITLLPPMMMRSLPTTITLPKRPTPRTTATASSQPMKMNRKNTTMNTPMPAPLSSFPVSSMIPNALREKLCANSTTMVTPTPSLLMTTDKNAPALAEMMTGSEHPYEPHNLLVYIKFINHLFLHLLSIVPSL